MTVLIFEEHSSVLPEWWRRGFKERTLVYFDAHLDLQHIHTQRLHELKQCDSLSSIQQLEKPHHLYPDRGYSFSIEDFLYAAHRLGIIDRLVWVVPPHVNTGYSEAVFNELQQMNGVLFEELMTFRRAVAGCVEGRILGLEITICDYRQLENLTLAADSLIDIDTDFFVAVPSDHVWISPRDIVRVLHRLPVKPELITFSRSVRSGFMPLEHRFIADCLAALWEDRHDDASHFERLLGLQQSCAGQRDVVVAACRRELVSYANCAATHYLLGRCESDQERAKWHCQFASELCPSYCPNVLWSACEILSRDLEGNGSAAILLDRQLSKTSQLPNDQSLAHAALGLIYCRCGDVDLARRKYQQCVTHLGDHPVLGLEIAKTYLQKNADDEAIPYLHVAAKDDKTRTSARVLLGQLNIRRGCYAEAAEQFEIAVKSAPAWMHLRRLLAATYEQLGQSEQSRALFEQYQDQRRRAAMLRNQLCP